MLSEQLEQLSIEVSASIVETPLTLFEMQIKGMMWHCVELLQASPGKAPKALDAVDMAATRSKLVRAMIDPKMLGIAKKCLA